ncbi:hypothetical protein EC988_004951, partial [Linderina pennispora]
VAVLSGDTALRWIFNNTGQRTIIVLIDVDDTFDRSSRQGPIYTPPASPEDGKQCGSDAEGPYGLALLRVIAHYAAIGVFRNVAPIAGHVLLHGGPGAAGGCHTTTTVSHGSGLPNGCRVPVPKYGVLRMTPKRVSPSTHDGGGEGGMAAPVSARAPPPAATAGGGLATFFLPAAAAILLL